jgi:hypothetical protein
MASAAEHRDKIVTSGSIIDHLLSYDVLYNAIEVTF